MHQQQTRLDLVLVRDTVDTYADSFFHELPHFVEFLNGRRKMPSSFYVSSRLKSMPSRCRAMGQFHGLRGRSRSISEPRAVATGRCDSNATRTFPAIA